MIAENVENTNPGQRYYKVRKITKSILKGAKLN